MSEPDAKKAEDAAGTDQWTQAVVDGMGAAEAAGAPADPSAGGSAEAATEEIPAVDLAAVVDAAGPIPESWFVNAEADDEVDAEQAPDAGDTPSGDPGGATSGDISVEDLVLDLERVTAERDQYLDASRRLQAEFENYKKQVGKRETEARQRANDSLIDELFPVLDAFDGAIANGAEDVAPMRSSFLDALTKQGLERIDPQDGVFDPNLHQAVLHEDADDVDGPVVAEVMLAGYAWKGRVLRPAMVRTRG